MIFTEEDNKYSLKVNPLSSPEELNKGLWLVIAGANDIPPHIALIADGEYYSVSARNVKVAEPIEKFLKAISRRSLPTLFVGIKPMHFVGLKEAFRKYPTLGNGEHTCHWPLRDFFSNVYSPEFADVHLVFELLAVAQKQDLLIECRSLFVDLKNDKTITLPKYTKEHIKERINSILKINE
ncbi:MAG TPA: hypothetical protein VN922_18245 [Bacteroidia bacterium]|nr:hypothetical protein [Bacteroidia bacterium]